MTAAGLLIIGITFVVALSNAVDTLTGETNPDDDLAVRIGTGLSQQVHRSQIDHFLKYHFVHRVDLLNHSSGSFYSIRRIKGINASRVPVHFLPYVESSERKCTFAETKTSAYQTSDEKSLAVEPTDPADKPSYQHHFRILFPKPIQPYEAFDVVFHITLPGELEDLNPDDEVMSIFLGRAVHGVDHLKFDVCLDYEPQATYVECKNKRGRYIDPEGQMSQVEPFNPETWYERRFNLTWNSQPYRVRFEVLNPSGTLYKIRYRRRKE